VTTPHTTSPLNTSPTYTSLSPTLSLQHDIFPRAIRPSRSFAHRTKAPPYFPRILVPTDDQRAITQPEQAFCPRNRPEPVCPTKAVCLPNPSTSLPLLQVSQPLCDLHSAVRSPLGHYMLTAHLQSFTSFQIMSTRESTTTDMIMGRGAYDTTGTPKPKPPPKKR
jgi:hypothetical protein